jgi:hypothetical protein
MHKLQVAKPSSSDVVVLLQGHQPEGVHAYTIYAWSPTQRCDIRFCALWSTLWVVHLMTESVEHFIFMAYFTTSWAHCRSVFDDAAFINGISVAKSV